MSYTEQITRPLIDTLTRTAGLPAFQLAGHVPNLAFWMGEVRHAVEVINGYQVRFAAMVAAQAEFDANDPGGVEARKYHDYEYQPARQVISPAQAERLIREIRTAADRLIERCLRENLLDIARADELRLIVDPNLFAPLPEAERAVINFYKVGDPFGEFSNFAPFVIRLKDGDWPTSEHYFQAQKFAGTPHEEELRLANSAMSVARMGRERTRPIRADWEAVKDDIMRQAVFAKFQQHPQLKKLLLSTGNSILIEHTKNDCYWGDCGDGSGKNMLGKILEETCRKLGGI